MRILYFFICILFILINSSCNNDKKLILDENFSSNQLGWVEENTSSHFAEILNGKYIIQSLDSNSNQTSCESYSKSYLWNLPEKYTLVTDIQLLDYKYSNSYFGFFLWSSTLEYYFEIQPDGKTNIWEYDCNTDKKTLFSSHDITFINNKQVIMELKVEKTSFELFINNKKITEGNFKSKSWSNFRFISSSQSTISIDYLQIYNPEDYD